MKKKEQGVLTVEATIVLMVFVMFVLFLYNFANVYRVQSTVSHAAIEAADAIALESYLREVAFESDPQDIVYLASKLGGSSMLDASALESLRSANLPKLAKDKFVLAIAKNETDADAKLKQLGVKNGLSGISFSRCRADLEGDNVIVFVEYIVELQFPVFGAREMRVTKAAKAKTFGEILYSVTTSSNNPEWGNTSGDNRVEQGEYVDIYATPNYGYRFVKWDDGNTDNPRRVYVTDVAKYKAIFEPTNAGVNLYLKRTRTSTKFRWDEAQEYGTVTGAGEYTYMGTASIYATAKEHFTFIGWDDNEDGIPDSTENPREIVVDKTHNITALYEANKYTITILSNNESFGKVMHNYVWGTGSSYGYSKQLEVEYKHKVDLEAIPETLYRFIKWENNDPNKKRVVEVVGDATYVANFERDTCRVSFYVNGQLYGNPQEVLSNSSIEGSQAITGSVMPANPKPSGQIFTGWRSNGKEFTGSTKISGETRVDAQFVAPSITISGGQAGANSTILSATTIPANMTVKWESSNNSVLSVLSGKITAKNEGVSTVTASFVYDGKTYSASKNITVGIDRIRLEQYNYKASNGQRHYFKTEVMDANEFPYNGFPHAFDPNGWATTGNLRNNKYNGIRYSKTYFFHRYCYPTGEELTAWENAGKVIQPGGFSSGTWTGKNMTNEKGYSHLDGVIFFKTDDVTYKIVKIS